LDAPNPWGRVEVAYEPIPFTGRWRWVGGALFTWLQDTVARQTDYWRALLGIVMLALVLVFPLGVAGGLKRIFIRDASA